MEYRKDQNIIDKLSTWLGLVALWSTPFVVAIIFYEVVLRYVFVNPTMWVNEMSLWVSGGAYLFAGLYAMRHRSHIRIFIIYDIVPRWVQHIFDCISVACLAVFSFAVIWGSFSEVKRKLLTMETYGTAWDPPIPGTIKPLILTFLALILIQAISNLICDWNKPPVTHDVTDEVDLEAIKANTLDIDKDVEK
ncbi:MAG: TRAP transporter small permease [Magnetovibrio sp.]|nr:TRAP transporter small permease [Magnetovibrio sp.]